MGRMGVTGFMGLVGLMGLMGLMVLMGHDDECERAIRGHGHGGHHLARKFEGEEGSM